MLIKDSGSKARRINPKKIAKLLGAEIIPNPGIYPYYPCFKRRKNIAIPWKTRMKNFFNCVKLIGIILIVSAFIFGVIYVRVWACKGLHPGASTLQCILSGGG
jgi:hypothetical protein